MKDDIAKKLDARVIFSRRNVCVVMASDDRSPRIIIKERMRKPRLRGITIRDAHTELTHFDL